MAGLQLSHGTTSEVGFGFIDDNDTGLMSPAANQAAVVAGGVKAVEATASALTLRAGSTTVASFGTTDYLKKVAKVSLAAVDTGGGVFAWQNPESGAVAVERVLLDVTTASSGACTVDVGTTATSATTSSDNLIDGLSLAATGLFSNAEEPGSNGKKRQRLAAGKWVTASVASGASSGLVGSAYIEYLVL